MWPGYRTTVNKGSATPVLPPENDVQTPPSSVLAMSASNRRDFARVARCRKPVMDRRADRTAPDRRLAGALMASDQQDDALTLSDRPIQRAVDRAPGAVERHAVKIDRPVGRDGAAAEAPVPASVKGRAGAGRRLRKRLLRSGSNNLQRCGIRCVPVACLLVGRIARKWPNCGRHPRPQRRFVRAERPHAPPRPWAAGHKRRHSRPFRRRSESPRALRPRMCRSGSAP